MHKKNKTHKTFGGETIFATHFSESTKTEMNFSYFLPKKKPESAIIWLSGLTCTEENFITKAGAQFHLKDSSTMIICPDSSPRGLGIAGEDDSYDFGTGASFYLNAKESPYSENYNMYDYIIKDLVSLIKDDFGITKLHLCGHSMGGHGALVIGLNNPDLFQSLSAFSPVVNPSQSEWGRKAFNGYLGEDKSKWKVYDACELLKEGKTHPSMILIDQGLSDNFYPDQLLTKNFEELANKMGQEAKVRYQENYDHSYYFISSFIKEHIDFHLGN